MNKAETREEIDCLIVEIKEKNFDDKFILLLLKSLYALNYKEENFKLSSNQMLLWLEFYGLILSELKIDNLNYLFTLIEIFARKSNKENQKEVFDKCGEISRLIYNRWQNG